MSGFPTGSGEGNNVGLDSLLAQLRQQQAKPPTLEPSYSYYNTGNNAFFGGQNQQETGYQQPSVSSPLPTPPVHGSQPHHPTSIMSPVDTPQPRYPAATGGSHNADRTSSLLNLLKFSQPSGTSSMTSAPIGTPLPQSRSVSSSYGAVDAPAGSSSHGRDGSNLLAALMGSQSKQATSASNQVSAGQAPVRGSFGAEPTSPPADTQAYLLQLLNKPKPSQSDSVPHMKQTNVFATSSKGSPDEVAETSTPFDESAINLMGSSAAEHIPSFGKENTHEPTPRSMFTYVNPFDKLAASSPRNRTPNVAHAGPSSAPGLQILKNVHPRHESPFESKLAEEKINMSSAAHTKRKPLETPSAVSSAPPTPLPDGRTQVEALIGIGSQKEPVRDALHDVGDAVSKQVQHAIAQAEKDESQAGIEKDLRDLLASSSNKEFEQTAKVAAQDIKKELQKDENSDVLDSLPTPIAKEIRDTIDQTAQGHIADSWESADADHVSIKEEENAVKVYNFPMRPWTSITIKDSEEARPTFRDEVVMDIARLKKEFDQVDRTLVTASNNFIVYGMSKNGGVRIIRQDDGKDARLFTDTHDRIFSAAISVSGPDLKEAIIGTGISGTVYWALVKDGEGDHIEESNPEMYGFALPPLQSQDIESPGGVLKTRARKSSNHPEFFAVGRGKYIHIIWPGVILKQSHLKNGKDRNVNTEKYLSQYSLKINTGKAGKDFTFSEDDTTVVSLDKAGRVKFWDIRSLTKLDASGLPVPTQAEIKEPLITFTTTPATEKSWPTSVLFVDKLRPYQRGGALRYIIVGMKQNHTLQLWDLGLGKPVQEIHLPHGKESDAVCSVMYHAATGMVIVGHPTRNSIYFLHLSAPKYNLPKTFTQAEYMQKLVANDASIPKPESTAVISGMREYFFANKGNLRSLDILQTPNATDSGSDSQTLFELYAMHSKGVTCLNVKQADLGWTSENKVIRSELAENAGVIDIETLKEIPAAPASEAGDSASQPTPSRIVPRPVAKETSVKDSPKKVQPAEPSSKPEEKVERKEPVRSNSGTAPQTPNERSEKKKRRKGTSSSESTAPGPSAAQEAQPAKPIVLDPSSNARNGNGKAPLSAIPESGPSRVAQDVDVNAIATEFKKLLVDSNNTLATRLKNDRAHQSIEFNAKQETLLRIVSETLSVNIEASLGRIIGAAVETSVIPVISEMSTKAVREQLSTTLNTVISQNLPKELQKTLPDAVGRALQHPQLLKLLSDSLAKSVAFKVEEQFTNLLHQVVTPAFTSLAVQTSQKVAGEVQRQASEQLQAIERQSRDDGKKIDQLTRLVAGLTETVASMASAQTDFQAEFLRLQRNDRRQSAQQDDTVRSASRPSVIPTRPFKTPEEEEFDELMDSINASMADGDYENAVIKWHRTGREQEFFEKRFVHLTSGFVQSLSPLMLLTIGATVSYEFTNNLIHDRIAWLNACIQGIQRHIDDGTIEDQVLELMSRILEIYVQRLEELFMSISRAGANEPILKTISQMVTDVHRIAETGNLLAHRRRR